MQCLLIHHRPCHCLRPVIGMGASVMQKAVPPDFLHAGPIVPRSLTSLTIHGRCRCFYSGAFWPAAERYMCRYSLCVDTACRRARPGTGCSRFAAVDMRRNYVTGSISESSVHLAISAARSPLTAAVSSICRAELQPEGLKQLLGLRPT